MQAKKPMNISIGNWTERCGSKIAISPVTSQSDTAFWAFCGNEASIFTPAGMLRVLPGQWSAV